MYYQVLSPYVTQIEGDTLAEAIKLFVKVNYNNQIKNMIIADQQDKYTASIKYYNENNKNKIGIKINKDDGYTVYPSNSSVQPIYKENDDGTSSEIVGMVVKNSFTPAQNLFTPAQNVFTPAQNLFTPAQNVFTPTQNVFTPTQNVFTPTQNVFTPTQNVFTPAQNTSSSLSFLASLSSLQNILSSLPSTNRLTPVVTSPGMISTTNNSIIGNSNNNNFLLPNSNSGFLSTNGSFLSKF